VGVESHCVDEVAGYGSLQMGRMMSKLENRLPRRKRSQKYLEARLSRLESVVYALGLSTTIAFAVQTIILVLDTSDKDDRSTSRFGDTAASS
jgi:hypothetical protein